MYTGPKLTNDNLVFGYDTGYGLDQHSSTRHYKGEPTTNLIASGIHGHHGSGSEISYKSKLYGLNSDAGVFQRNFVNNPAQANTSTYNNNAGLNHSGLSFTALSTNTEYVLISFDFYMITPYVRHSASSTGLNGYMRILYTDGSYGIHSWNTSLAGNAGDDWNNNSAYIGQWRKIGLIADLTNSKTPASINAFYIYNDRTVTGDGVFTNFIITEHATIPTSPKLYTSSSRSDTASLIDLKKTTDIDVSSVSFDSTGQPEFDGTDDILNTGLLSGRNPSTQPFTIEAIVKSDITSGSRMWVDATSNGSGQRLYCAHAATGTNTPLGIQNSGWGSSVPHDTNYHHYVITMNGSTAQLYNNGVAHSNKSYTSYGIQALNVGGRSSYRWIGKIPVFKIYDTVLTATEIKSNFNAYKNRFDL